MKAQTTQLVIVSHKSQIEPRICIETSILLTAKSSLFGTTVTVPITDGRMNLGVSCTVTFGDLTKEIADYRS